MRPALIAVVVLAPALARADRIPDSEDKPEGEVAPPKPERTPPKPIELEVVDDAGFRWKPFGFLRLQYIAVQNDPNVAFVGRDDGFELQNARIGVAGNWRGKADFVVSIDGAVDERAQINVPEGKLRVGLRDAYADVFAPKGTTVRGGFFKATVDSELGADYERDFVDRAIESRGMRATEGFQTPGLTAGRSLGAAFRLEPGTTDKSSPVGFELAIQNGADEFASNNDNDKPALSGAILFRTPPSSGGKPAFWAEGVLAGRFNPRTVGDLPFRQDEDDVQGIAAVRIVASRLSLSGGVVFQTTSYPTVGGPDATAFGGHAQLMIGVGTPNQPIAIGYRFGILDPSSLITTDRVMEHTAGIVLGMPRLHMRLQLQVTHVIEQAARDLANDRAQLAAEIQL